LLFTFLLLIFVVHFLQIRLRLKFKINAYEKNELISLGAGWLPAPFKKKYYDKQ
jgi:hypothetical protein